MKPTITIVYCTRCKWLTRASWMTQELLTTFEEELGQVNLRPNQEGGVFDIYAEEDLIFSRREESRFPEITELKRLIRDRFFPERDLGHIEKTN